MSRPGWMSVLALAFALVAAPAFGQGGTTSATLSGVVTDDQNAVVIGATALLTNKATAEAIGPIVTNDRGAYSFPAVSPGTWILKITMPSFKTHEVEIRLQGGVNSTQNVKLELGKIEQTVNVVSGSEIARLDTPTVSTTFNADVIQKLPRADRNALNFLVFAPGVTTVGSTAGARNNTTIAGLPTNTFNITIDGISNSNLLQSGDGFFSLVVPRLDAVEEVTLTTASAGADATGQGAVQIRFVTRSGTNQFETSLYYFLQHANLNSNTYFNRLAGLPVPAATNYTYGGRVGGPIILPGFDGRGRAFFFFNQEEVYNPIETARTRTIISQNALAGNYCWANGASCQNVLALAAANGHVSTYDPTIKTLLDDILAASATTGTIEQLVTSPNTASYRWLVPNKGIRHSPTTNITVNLNSKNRIQGSYYWQRFNNTPDTLNNADATFPGFPAFGDQSSYRTTASMSLRSTLSASMVNEVRGGWQWSPVGFFVNSAPDMFANQGNYAVGLGFGLTNAHPGNSNSPSERNTANWTVSDQFNWLKGSHSFQFGGDFTRIDDWNIGYNNVPTIGLGLAQSGLDPADSMFSTVNFPGTSGGERNSARALYALLTGRVTSVGATGRLNEAGTEYVYNGPLLRREIQDDYSFYAQDQWRWKPTVTFTLGVRYQYTLPMTAKNGVFTTISSLRDACGISGSQATNFPDGGNRFCNMMSPGEILDPTAPAPSYVQYSAKTKGYNTDLNNIAPNLGVAWRPNVQEGMLRSILGDPEIASVAGGYSRSFNRERLDQFLGVYNGNPGQTVPATRSTQTGAFPMILPGESYPVLYRETNRLGPPAFQTQPIFPIPASFTSGSWLFHPDIEVPYTDSWNMSFQRAVGKDMVAEIRYQGNTNRGAWTFEDWNSINVYETGWLNGEFELAQQNLRANLAAGLTNAGFAYTGAPGTSPLPLTLAHFMGRSNANSPAAYTINGAGTGSYGLFTNATFTGDLDPFFPDPYGFASNLYGGTTAASQVPAGMSTRLFTNAMNLGTAANFWVMNPSIDEVQVQTNSTNKPYNHFVIMQLRRRLAQGLTVQGSYTWSRNFTTSLQDFHLDRFPLRGQGVPHNFQIVYAYDIPVGRGKQFGANMNAWADGFVGGWTFSGTLRFQRQSYVLRDAVLVGFTQDDLQDMMADVRFTTDPVTGAQLVFNFPEDVYVNTRLAYATDELSLTGYPAGAEPWGPLGMDSPTGGPRRYFQPAGGVQADGSICNWIYPGDCGTEEIWVLGRWFHELDFRLAKQFPLPGRARFELSIEVFNATMAKNFPLQSNDGNNANNGLNPGSGASTFRIRQTQSPARTAQVVWRVSW